MQEILVIEKEDWNLIENKNQWGWKMKEIWGGINKFETW